MIMEEIATAEAIIIFTSIAYSAIEIEPNADCAVDSLTGVIEKRPLEWRMAIFYDLQARDGDSCPLVSYDGYISKSARYWHRMDG